MSETCRAFIHSYSEGNFNNSEAVKQQLNNENILTRFVGFSVNNRRN